MKRLFILEVIFLIAIAWIVYKGITHKEPPGEVSYDTLYVTRVDTFKLHVPYARLKFDTLKVTDTLTNTVEKIPYFTAFYDTTLTKNSDTLNLKVEYKSLPLNTFDITFDIKSKIKEITKTVKEYIRTPLYEQPFFWLSILQAILLIIIA